MNIKKNDYFEIKIIDIGINGEGIGKIDNFTIFVKNALPNEFVKIKILKVLKNYAFAKLIEILEPSVHRVLPPCKYFGKCGGCQLQHLQYEEQLKLKTKIVKDNLKKIGGFNNTCINDTIPAKNNFFYRNKASFPINFKNQINVGFYAPNSHNIIDIDNCIINHPINSKIIYIFKHFLIKNNITIYNEDTKSGLVKHIVIRTAKKTNKVLICVVVNANSLNKHIKNLLKKCFDDIKNCTIVINFNTQKNNVILGEKIEVLHGAGYITDYINNLKFNISPISFFQINTEQTEVLYKNVLKFANLNKNDIVFDAYCGIGTISLFLAQNAKFVYGIEIVKQAIEDAKKNALMNDIKNVEFFTGKAEEVIPSLILKKGIIPDIIVIDPPRKGCDFTLLDCIIKANIKKIIYVSCDSATLARDLKHLDFKYKIESVQPVDMFCMTSHIETIVCLKQKDKFEVQ